MANDDVQVGNQYYDNYGGNGGAYWLNDCDNATVYGDVFVNNTASKGSGGLELNSVTGIVQLCKFNSNQGVKGGALYESTSTTDITSCSFVSNKASQSGGAVYRCVLCRCIAGWPLWCWHCWQCTSIGWIRLRLRLAFLSAFLEETLFRTLLLVDK